jgi:hypothetical protein
MGSSQAQQATGTCSRLRYVAKTRCSLTAAQQEKATQRQEYGNTWCG